MYIRDFRISGFGVFSDQSVQGLPDGISIFLGHNEAGKSTCLDFFRTMLFGFLDGRSKERKYPPLRGGDTGGSLLLDTSTHGSMRLERYPGKGGGTVTLTAPDGTPLDTSLLDTLTGGMTRELFKSVYGFSLSELQAFDSLSDDKVRHALYGATFGTGGRPVGAVLADLEKRMQSLFRSGGSKPVINSLMKELEELQTQIRNSADTIDQYDAACLKLESLERNLQSITEQYRSKHTEANRIERHLGLWDQWVRYRKTEAELSTISPVVDSFPDDGLTRLDSVQQRINDAVEALARQQAIRDRLQQEYVTNQPRTDVLAAKESISRLAEGKSRYHTQLERITTLQRDQRERDTRFAALASTLGPEWSEDKVRNADRSMFSRNSIEEMHTRLEEARAEHFRRKDTVAARRQDMESAIREEQEAQSACTRLGTGEAENHAEILEKLEARLPRMEQIFEELPAISELIRLEEEECRKRIRDLVPHWDMDMVRTVDTSFSVRNRIEQAGGAIQNAEQHAKAMQLRTSTASQQHEQAKARHDALAQELQQFSETLQSKSSKLSERAELAEKAEKADRPKLTDRPDRPDQANQANQADLTDRPNKTTQTDQSASDASGMSAAHSASAIEARRNAIGTLRKTLAERDAAQMRLELMEQADQKAAQNIPAADIAAPVMLILFGAGSLGLYASGISPALSGGTLSPDLFLGLGVVLCVAAIFRVGTSYFRSRKAAQAKAENTSIQTSDHLREVIRSLTETAQQAAQAAHAPTADQTGLETAEQLLEQLREQSAELASLQRALTDARRDMDAAQQTVAKARYEREQADEALQSARDEWAALRKTLSLPEDASPANALSIFDRLEAPRNTLETIARRKEEAKQHRASLDSFAEQAATLPAVQGLTEHKDILNAVRGQITEQQHQRELEQERKQAQHVFKKAEARRIHAEQQLSAATQAEQKALQNLEALSAQWKGWLEQHDLQTSLTPSTALKAWDTINDCLTVLQQRDATEEELAALRTETAEYARNATDTANTLAVSAGDDMANGTRAITACVDKLSALLRQEQEKALKHSRIAEELPQAEQECDAAHTRLVTLEAERRQLLVLGGVPEPLAIAGEYSTAMAARNTNSPDNDNTDTAISPRNNLSGVHLDSAAHSNTINITDDEAATKRLEAEELFRQRAYAYAERRDLLREQASLKAGLEAVAGESGIDGLSHTLANTDRDALQSSYAAVKSDAEYLEQQADALRKDIAETKAEAGRLASADELAALRAEEEALRETIRRHALEWSRLAVTRHVIQQAKHTFENERQPQVIRHAGHFFNIITNGVYSGLRTALEDGTINAVRATGHTDSAPAIVPHTDLSRGAAEQLYLSLRLGYILNHAASGEPMPVIMDDILVNFDPQRAAHTAKAFGELAGKNQILFFTCHPQTVDILQENISNSAVYTIDNGTISASG